jgi:hypothetical protein
VAFSPQANDTDWATATCWQNLVPTFVDRGVSHGQHSRLQPWQITITWEQLSTGNFLNPLGPCWSALLQAPTGLTSTALRWAALQAVIQPLSKLLLLICVFCLRAPALFCFLLLISSANRLTLVACFLPNQEEAHVTADMIWPNMLQYLHCSLCDHMINIQLDNAYELGTQVLLQCMVW